MRRAATAALALTLTGCSGQFAFGPPAAAPPPTPATTGPQRLIVENGQVIQEPLTPIESTIEGLSQAQTVRTLVKQLSRNR
jgi:hypothetical protein